MLKTNAMKKLKLNKGIISNLTAVKNMDKIRGGDNLARTVACSVLCTRVCTVESYEGCDPTV